MEIGKNIWYIDRRTPNFMVYFDGTYNRSYGWKGDGEWFINEQVMFDNWRLIMNEGDVANCEEVKERLLAEAEKRGFVEGAYFRGVKDKADDSLRLNGDLGVRLVGDDKGIFYENSWIMHNGIWGKVVKSPCELKDVAVGNPKFNLDTKSHEVLKLLEGLSYTQANAVMKHVNKLLPHMSILKVEE